VTRLVLGEPLLLGFNDRKKQRKPWLVPRISPRGNRQIKINDCLSYLLSRPPIPSCLRTGKTCKLFRFPMIGLDHAAGNLYPAAQGYRNLILITPRDPARGLKGHRHPNPALLPTIPDYPSIPPDTEPLVHPLSGFIRYVVLPDKLFSKTTRAPGPGLFTYAAGPAVPANLQHSGRFYLNLAGLGNTLSRATTGNGRRPCWLPPFCGYLPSF
jgi:hypothetical protein